jgi:hypothetical protein
MVKQRKIGYYPFNLEYQQSMREKAIVFLGGKCSSQKCLVPNGCSDKRCLQIDHINGISDDEPRLIGTMLYEDILHNPKSREKYQLLCANCNWIKRFDKNENRGYRRFIQSSEPKLPLAIMGGCTNPTISCRDCGILGCDYRVKSKTLFGLTDALKEERK